MPLSIALPVVSLLQRYFGVAMETGTSTAATALTSLHELTEDSYFTLRLSLSPYILFLLYLLSPSLSLSLSSHQTGGIKTYEAQRGTRDLKCFLGVIYSVSLSLCVSGCIAAVACHVLPVKLKGAHLRMLMMCV